MLEVVEIISNPDGIHVQLFGHGECNREDSLKLAGQATLRLMGQSGTLAVESSLGACV
jgi:hypothetical protein